jgi:hypothetical protein
MRKALLMAFALALSAASAQAQGRDRNRDDDDGWKRDHREYRQGRDRDDDDEWRDKHRGRFGGGGGARFFVQSGETRLTIVCDSGESMRNCVDAALTLLDRAKQAGSAAPSATTGGSSTSPARP